MHSIGGQTTLQSTAVNSQKDQHLLTVENLLHSMPQAHDMCTERGREESKREPTCPILAFSHTKVSKGLASSGGNSLMSNTWTVTATRLVRTGLSGEENTT